MTIQPVRQTVILAAGMGRRIDSRRQGMPKPLLEVGGRPLLEHALREARVAGCTEAVVVVGSEAEQVVEFLDTRPGELRVRVVHNADFREPNGNSLLAAQPWVEGRFYLQMADHVFLDPPLPTLARAGAADPDGMFLLVDPAPRFFDEDDITRVRCDSDGRIHTIGKHVEPWDVVDTGLFLLDSRAFAAIREIPDPGGRSLSAGMQLLADRDELRAVPLRGAVWLDVDTPDELRQARDLFARRGEEAPEAGGLVAAAGPASSGKPSA